MGLRRLRGIGVGPHLEHGGFGSPSGISSTSPGLVFQTEPARRIRYSISPSVSRSRSTVTFRQPDGKWNSSLWLKGLSRQSSPSIENW